MIILEYKSKLLSRKADCPICLIHYKIVIILIHYPTQYQQYSDKT